MYCEQLDKADTDTSPEATMNGNDDLIGVFSVPTKGSEEAEESSQKVIVDRQCTRSQDSQEARSLPLLLLTQQSTTKRSHSRWWQEQ
jgi:hypothetical protein